VTVFAPALRVSQVKEKFMLKTLVIITAILIAVVNVSAQNAGTNRRHTSRKAGVIRVGPSVTYLKEGFSLEEVLRLLGEPTAISERQSGNQFVTTYEFPRGQNRYLIAEFVNDSLVSSRIETREQIALGDR
jgi:hypothetical protein